MVSEIKSTLKEYSLEEQKKKYDIEKKLEMLEILEIESNFVQGLISKE
jgi:hypothetical protein